MKRNMHSRHTHTYTDYSSTDSAPSYTIHMYTVIANTHLYNISLIKWQVPCVMLSCRRKVVEQGPWNGAAEKHTRVNIRSLIRTCSHTQCSLWWMLLGCTPLLLLWTCTTVAVTNKVPCGLSQNGDSHRVPSSMSLHILYSERIWSVTYYFGKCPDFSISRNLVRIQWIVLKSQLHHHWLNNG